MEAVGRRVECAESSRGSGGGEEEIYLKFVAGLGDLKADVWGTDKVGSRVLQLLPGHIATWGDICAGLEGATQRVRSVPCVERVRRVLSNFFWNVGDGTEKGISYYLN